MPVADVPRSVPRGHDVMAAGHRTNYYDEGAGAPLVLLHGSGPGVSAYSNWHGVVPLLSDRFRTIAPDMAGFGLTEFLPDGRYDMKLWSAHLLALLDALEVQRAVLVGNSFGGALAAATAVFAPERVAGLVLLGAPAGEFPMTTGLRAGWHYEPSPDNMRAILAEFPYDPSLVTEDMVAQRYELSARPGAQDAFRRLVPEPAPDGGTVRGASAGFLAKVAAPTLVVHGREDRVVPVAAGMFASAHIPGADLHVFGRCGHWVQLERAADFAADVAYFAGGLS